MLRAGGEVLDGVEHGVHRPVAVVLRKLALASVALAVTGSAAMAADLYVPETPAPIVEASGVGFEGLYAGVHGGYSTGSLSDRSSNASVGMTGGALGAHVGYNAQFGSFVFGLEGDGTWSNTDGNGTFAGPVSLYTQQDWQSSLRLRAGYALGNWLFYATGGAALTGIDATLSSPGLSLRASDTYLGYAAGGGIEYKMSESVSARVEALHYGYGDKSLRFSTGSLPIDIDTTVVRAGLTFQFR